MGLKSILKMPGKVNYKRLDQADYDLVQQLTELADANDVPKACEDLQQKTRTAIAIAAEVVFRGKPERAAFFLALGAHLSHRSLAKVAANYILDTEKFFSTEITASARKVLAGSRGQS